MQRIYYAFFSYFGITNMKCHLLVIIDHIRENLASIKIRFFSKKKGEISVHPLPKGCTYTHL